VLLASGGWPQQVWAIAQVCIGLGFVIFVHEMGHFLVAKACGVKCEKFYVGFDFFDIKIGKMVLVPRSLFKFQWGETEYGVGIIPLGGYVKMLGQDDNPGNFEKEVQRSKGSGNEQNLVGPPSRTAMDPRSFLAKSVPQRMAIISAGVIVNLIFAVLFAAVAFRTGVSYEPAIIGDVAPGGPAWEENLAGAKLVQIGEKKVEGFYRFLDIAQDVALAKPNQPILLQYSWPGSSQTQKVELTPRRGLIDITDAPMLGISNEVLAHVGGDPKSSQPGSPAANAEPPFLEGDRIVKISSEPVLNGLDLKRILAQNFDKRLDFEVERQKNGSPVSVQIPVDPNPMRDLGMTVAWGKITSIQKLSPASDCGIQPGDEILKIDGEDRGDLFALDQRMRTLARENKQVTLTIRRGESDLDVTIAPRNSVPYSVPQFNQPIAINSLGVAIETTRIVSESELAGIGPGAEVIKIEFLPEGKEQQAVFKELQVEKAIDLVKEKLSWGPIHRVLQMLPTGFKFKVTAKIGDQLKEATGQARESSEFFNPQRGIPLKLRLEEYRSPNWTDALIQGYKQTIADATRVFKFLGRLIRGELSTKNLGGPAMIAVVATSEASQGTSRLLLFLTLLSANLAVVNFLPIPVLDGGHMVFLAYEGLFRQPPNEKVQIILTYAGLFLVLGLMLYVVFLDIQRFSDWF
jgi:regulator of sigma E protease